MRIVILTYESLFSNLMTERLLRELPEQVVGIIRSDCLLYNKTIPESVLYLLRETGLRFVGRKALELFQSRATAIAFRLIGRQPKVNALRTMRQLYDVPVVGSTNVNNPETLQQIDAWQPDLIISVYFNQLIGRKVIKRPTKGTINIHPALLPKYRGLFPYFWALTYGEQETGVTIHWVDPKFDTGALLLQRKLDITSDDTIISLSYRSAVLGADMLVEAIELIENDNAPRIEQDHTEASYFSLPKPADQRRFRANGGQYGTIFELWKYM